MGVSTHILIARRERERQAAEEAARKAAKKAKPKKEKDADSTS